MYKNTNIMDDTCTTYGTLTIQLFKCHGVPALSVREVTPCDTWFHPFRSVVYER